MGEEVKMTDYGTSGGRGWGGGIGSGGGSDEERFLGWEVGLPSADDLTPLSQRLIPPELACAFSITPEPCRTVLDVNRASKNTLSTIRGGSSQDFSSNNFKSLDDDHNRDPMVWEADEEFDRDGSASDSKRLRKVHSAEEADSAVRTDNPTDDPSARTLKRTRLVWTPQLHKRFVDVVAHLGIKNAVPKTIMQLMNVEGLTRENVASHLQKYRLYLKRMQGLSNDGPSSSDHLFASTPVPQSLNESGGNGHAHGNGHMPMPIPMPYPPTNMMPMPVMGMNHGHGQARMGMTMSNPNGPVGYPGFEAHQYSMMQQSDWSGNNFGTVMSYPHHVAPNNK